MVTKNTWSHILKDQVPSWIFVWTKNRIVSLNASWSYSPSRIGISQSVFNTGLHQRSAKITDKILIITKKTTLKKTLNALTTYNFCLTCMCYLIWTFLREVMVIINGGLCHLHPSEERWPHCLFKQSRIWTNNGYCSSFCLCLLDFSVFSALVFD